MKFDYLIVGAGLFGCICARELTKKGNRVLVIDRRNHIGGNIYTENVDGIQVHKYGAHIFHTNDKFIWEYVNSHVEFNRFTNSPIANYNGQLYNLPFNMNTFYKLWGVSRPNEALKIIEEQKGEMANLEPMNLEEQAIKLVGRDIYETLIKGYTEKQWGRSAKELPAFIIKRLPVRFSFDNNYFSDKYQGIPIGGYTKLIESLLDGINVLLDEDFFDNKNKYLDIAQNIIYTGPIDRYYDYCFGKLEYRSLVFNHERLNIKNYQGNAVVNYTDFETPYTRIIEHKFFDYVDTNHTIISYEYPSEWDLEKEPYYPINDLKNMDIYKKYRLLSIQDKKIYFGGRLAEYKYYDMHQVIRSALNLVSKLG